MVPCPNLVLFASTIVSCAGRSATRYRAVRESLPCVPTDFQGSKCVRGVLKLKRREYQVRDSQIRANALLLSQCRYVLTDQQIRSALPCACGSVGGKIPPEGVSARSELGGSRRENTARGGLGSELGGSSGGGLLAGCQGILGGTGRIGLNPIVLLLASLHLPSV